MGSRTEPTIRTAATILLSLLIALAIGTAAYAAILAIGRAPTPRAEEPVQLPNPQPLPTPKPLETAPGFDGAIATEAGIARRARRELSIHVTDVAAELGDEVGVATFHAHTGSNFQWLPLADVEADGHGARVVTANVVDDSLLTITFAARRSHARHGYLQRLTVDLARRGEDEPPVTLRGDFTTVLLQLPTHADRAGPFRLQRADDRMWLPMLHGTSGLTLEKGRELSLRLGLGPYELQDPLHPDRSQRFDVPNDGIVVLSDSLAPPRDGRL